MYERLLFMWKKEIGGSFSTLSDSVRLSEKIPLLFNLDAFKGVDNFTILIHLIKSDAYTFRLIFIPFTIALFHNSHCVFPRINIFYNCRHYKILSNSYSHNTFSLCL